MADFVKVVDASEQVHVINTRQIVRVYQNHPPAWDVILTHGDPVTLSMAEAEKLFRHEPAVQHGPVQHGPVQHEPVQHEPVQHEPAVHQEPAAQHGQRPRALGAKLTDH
jgi:hypothetical protein